MTGMMLAATAYAQGTAKRNVTLLIKLGTTRAQYVTRLNPSGARISALGMLSLLPDDAEPVVFGPEVIEHRGTALVRVGARAGGKYTLQVWPRGEQATYGANQAGIC